MKVLLEKSEGRSKSKGKKHKGARQEESADALTTAINTLVMDAASSAADLLLMQQFLASEDNVIDGKARFVKARFKGSLRIPNEEAAMGEGATAQVIELHGERQPRAKKTREAS